MCINGKLQTRSISPNWFTLKYHTKYLGEMSSQTIPTSVECHVCQKKFLRQNNLNKHLKNIHSTSRLYECKECNVSFQTQSCWKIHMRVHKKANRFHCDICDNTYASRKVLRVHMSLHFPVPVSCKICQKSFTLKRYLNRHLKYTHSQERPLNCDHCGRGFKRKHNLISHILTHFKWISWQTLFWTNVSFFFTYIYTYRFNICKCNPFDK